MRQITYREALNEALREELARDERVFLLGAWPGRERRRSDIRDPMGRSKRVYEEVFRVIAGHLERVLPYLDEMFPAQPGGLNPLNRA